jgi:uncharacterized protein YndB with AHSA1/START domain
MQTLNFSIKINAPKEKVWHMMLQKDTYKLWAATFSEGSAFEGSWDKGAKIKFVDPQGEGMTAIIEENKPFEFISIRHLGFVKNGVEDFESEEAKSWAPAYENYTFKEEDGVTEVIVDIQVVKEFEEMFKDLWPKALAKLKEITEKTMQTITVETLIKAPVEKVWEAWTVPSHIKNWAFASEDWGVGEVENNLIENGKFKTEMAAKDGSAAFDFAGIYNDIQINKAITYTMGDGRRVKINFEEVGDATKVIQTFDMEPINSEELQRTGWQAILDNFKRYVESLV